MSLDNITFKLGCTACPEAYDVFYKDEAIAYARLRHGNFSLTVTKVHDEPIIYHAEPKGDGMFDSEYERGYYLNEARLALTKWLEDNTCISPDNDLEDRWESNSRK
jgi:hypothetical protein